jgi:hypothetical protein
MASERTDKLTAWRRELEKQADEMREHLEQQEADDFDKDEQQVTRPPKGDPQNTQDHIARGGRDTPAGGSTGGYMGGSANKRKGQSD